MSIFLKTEDEIELMREANLLVGKTLAEVGRHVKPGITTLQLDKIAEEFIRDNGAIPTFKGFPSSYGPPFPGSICASVNDVVVHGVPSEDVVLKDGDIIYRRTDTTRERRSIRTGITFECRYSTIVTNKLFSYFI